MRKLVFLSAGVAVAALLGGCAHHGRRGLTRQGPDEFAVARNAPLVIPPDYSLQPPQPGAAPTQGQNPSAQALDALFGGPAARSGSERATLSAAGDDAADPGVRSDAGDPDTNVVDKGATTRDIVAAPPGDGRSARASAGGK